ncbi:MAG: hypothetical protein R3E10_00695 [Gemmatimonadota bacterium]
MRSRVVAAALVFASVCVARLEAQVGWDSPMLLAPDSPGGLQVFLVDPDASDGVGAMALWRRSRAPSGLGFRVGVTEDVRSEAVVFAGVDFSGPLTQAGDDFPLDVIWVSGLGASLGENVLVSLPIGVSLGRVVRSPDVRILPYGTPRVVVDGFIGDDPAREDIGVDVVVDLGADLAFDAGWAVRFAVTVGDRQAVAIGAAFGSGLR